MTKSFFSLLTFLLFLTASIPLPGASEWKFPLQKAEELKTWAQSYNAVIANGGAQFSLGEKQRGMHGIYKTFPVSEMNGKLIRITGERRGSNLVLPEKDFLGPKTMFIITCKGGQTHYPGVSGKFGTYSWEPFESLCKIPENAERIELFLGMQSGSGTFGLRNLRIAVAGTPLNLARYGNMGYVDKTAGDGKGGWSDQGAGNDGRFFRWPHLAKNEFANVPFFPVVSSGCFDARADIRGIGSCPLLYKNIKPDKKFLIQIRKTGRLFSRNDELKQYIINVNCLLDDIVNLAERTASYE